MTADDLLKRVRWHNGLKVGTGVALLPLSAGLWVASFWICRILFALPLDLFVSSGWEASFYVAWVMMVVLAVEGVRYGKPLFDLADYARSGYRDNLLMESDSIRALNRYAKNPLGMAYIISQALFCAPHCTVEALKAFRSLLRIDQETAAEAAAILRELKRSRKWTPVSAYAKKGAALMLLRRLDLIWMRAEAGEIEVRYPAGTD